MELLNATKMQAGYTTGMQPGGRELLVVVVKGTFNIPKFLGEKASLADKQVPLIEADVFTGEPGLSAPVYESDYPPRKPNCDVLLNGTCYAPGGQPSEKVLVTLKIGSLSKSFYVVGDRQWKKGFFQVKATPPTPFTTMPISYNKAFGGQDVSHPDKAKHKAYISNPIGIGFHDQLKADLINGRPLPNTEEQDRPIIHPRKEYKPMAFGPIGRNWPPRPKFAGTYDQNWLDNGFPFLPPDFNDAYYQAAPLDQQMPYPEGGEEVVLNNLIPEGRTQFKLPIVKMPVVFFLKDGEKKTTEAVIDTIVIEPDLRRFMVVWRSALPLRRSIFDVVQVVAGEMPPRWYRARELGKEYYGSLGELVAARGRSNSWEE